MLDILFHRQDYPFSILKEFGLTEQMIMDLPESVHISLERGGYSPLLPIKIEQPFGYTECYARFFLIDTEEGISLMFSPKLKKLDLEQFSDKEKQLLLSGKTIVADIIEDYENDATETQKIKAFVQIDTDTNRVVYTPTQIIGRNLSSIGQEFDLSEEVLESFWNGEIATVKANIIEDEDPVEISIGIDLFSITGVEVVCGNADDWERTVHAHMPEYSFGSDGCWINRDGKLSYVADKDFTDDILQALERQSQRNEQQNILNKEDMIETIMEQSSTKYQQVRP